MTKSKPHKFAPLIESGDLKNNGDSTYYFGKFNFKKEEFLISNNDLSKRFKKPIGRYSLLSLPNILNEDKISEKYYFDKLKETLLEYIINIKKTDTILVVGLGNRHISADSLGTEVVKNINITRNLIDNVPLICAIAPSVMGLTGIETADTISGVISKVKPNYIIMIDTLCAGDVSRLGISFQISNTPISPGSGIKNNRKKLNTNINTISIGVPLVVYSNTFIKSAINKLDIDIKKIKDPILKNQIKQLYNNNFNELVTLNEIEYVVKHIGKFIANAINEVLLNGH